MRWFEIDNVCSLQNVYIGIRYRAQYVCATGAEGRDEYETLFLVDVISGFDVATAKSSVRGRLFDAQKQHDMS